MSERSTRESEQNSIRARVRAGRMNARKLGQRPSDRGVKPVAGSQPRVTAKTKMRMMPIMKLGTDSTEKVTPVTTRSIGRPAR